MPSIASIAGWLDSQFGWKLPRTPEGAAPGWVGKMSSAPTVDSEALTDVQQREFEQLCAECDAMEREQLWLPMHSDCSTCHGYVFAVRDDVSSGLGVCGCVVAVEMELAAKEENINVVLSLAQLKNGMMFPIKMTPALQEAVQPAACPPNTPLMQKKHLRGDDRLRRTRQYVADRHMTLQRMPIKQQRTANRLQKGARKQ